MIDSFTIRHFSGACGAHPFGTGHFLWPDRKRIRIATGERIHITLYGNGADFAQDAVGSNLYEWIDSRGTTQDYPGASPMFGVIPPKGFVTVAVRAAAAHGTGNRTVTVTWLTGNETLAIEIVANCAALQGAPYRQAASGIGAPVPPQPRRPRVLVPIVPNVMPALMNPVVLTRSLLPDVIATPAGGMVRVSDFFGDGLTPNVVTVVPVPDLTWGVSGVNAELANTQFDVQLVNVADAANPRVLDTLTLPNGFPANTPLVTRNNYPGRPTTLRVIRDPSFQMGPVLQTFPGCFTEPGSQQLLDPTALMLIADSTNRINEGTREGDNELRF